MYWNVHGQSKILTDQWSPEKNTALASVLGLYAHVCPHRVGIIIDGTPRSEPPAFAGKRGLYCNLGRSGLKSPDRMPADLFQLVTSKGWTRLVWLSASVAAGDAAGVLWDLAHELRHLEQEQDCPELFSAGIKLYEHGSSLWGEDTPWMNVPTEVDCELAAWRVFRELRSDAEARRLIGARAADSSHSRNAQALLARHPDEAYPVYDEILALLHEHRSRFEQITSPGYTAELLAAIAKRRRVRGSAVL